MEDINTRAADSDKEVVVKIEHLQKRFGANEVLKDINLELHKGENLAIIGRSGQGKSVTIKCIVGLLTYDAGSVQVLSKEVKDRTEEELRAMRIKVGFLFQGSALYDSMTVYENLAFPLRRALRVTDKKKIDVKVQEMLAGVDLKDAGNKMPADLSGGMRKRIALARSLILEPEIMLYDEPTTGLDPLTSKEISELIVNMQNKYMVSSLIITHDMPCARITSNRILVMNNGEYIGEGTYEQLEKSHDKLICSFFK